MAKWRGSPAESVAQDQVVVGDDAKRGAVGVEHRHAADLAGRRATTGPPPGWRVHAVTVGAGLDMM